MKKILILILVLTAAICFTACKDDKSPEMSSSFSEALKQEVGDDVLTGSELDALVSDWNNIVENEPPEVELVGGEDEDDSKSETQGGSSKDNSQNNSLNSSESNSDSSETVPEKDSSNNESGDTSTSPDDGYYPGVY